MFDLFLPQATLRALRLCEIIFVFFSRKGAKAAKNFFICFVLAPNTSACSASLREFIVFVSRRGAEAAVSFNVWFVFAPNTFAYFAPWRDYICFFSRRGAGSAENFNVLLLPQTPLRALRLGESKYRWIFLYRQFRLYWQKIIVRVWVNATLAVRLNPDYYTLCSVCKSVTSSELILTSIIYPELTLAFACASLILISHWR